MLPERMGEKRDSDFGEDTSGWRPGDEDPNTRIVHEESEFGRPGVAPPPVVVDFHGMYVSPEQAARLEEEARAREKGSS